MSKVKDVMIVIYNDRKARFLFVGMLNTIVGYGTYALVIYTGLHYFLAQFIASVVGITHSYLWNKYFTFRKYKKSLSEIYRFVFVYAGIYLFNMLLLYLSVERLGINEYAAGVVCMFFTAVVSYVGHKKFSFR
ncbi:MAG: GtrA family protein [Candidatus Goldiibacteriota bacterium]